ncbi:hypothetical protein [Nonomuraea guangzhouensis]|uniref:Uncharacterized protein n=1 Tax=Nonomuraea guangzhouensis TaxID=1291555 RepID=A0ABW4GTC7_9ACTN|nr:hypothetical protein [Nonomuraea guangzhouensis]
MYGVVAQQARFMEITNQLVREIALQLLDLAVEVWSRGATLLAQFLYRRLVHGGGTSVGGGAFTAGTFGEHVADGFRHLDRQILSYARSGPHLKDRFQWALRASCGAFLPPILVLTVRKGELVVIRRRIRVIIIWRSEEGADRLLVVKRPACVAR